MVYVPPRRGGGRDNGLPGEGVLIPFESRMGQNGGTSSPFQEHGFFFFSSLAERAITAVPVTALP